MEEPKIEIDFESDEFYPIIGGHVFVNDTKFVFITPGPGTKHLGQPLPRGAIMLTEKQGERLPEQAEIYAGLHALRRRFPDRELYIQTPDGIQKVEVATKH